MFGKSYKLFRLFGFEVGVDASWLLIAVLLAWSLAVGFFPAEYPGLSTSTYWAMGLIGAVLLFLSIVFHELFHSLVARKYDIPMKGITLFLFGGVANMEREPPTPKSEFLMAAAGPAASIGLGFVLLGLYLVLRDSASLAVTGVLAYLYRINWILAAFNLIPAFPLDGGRMLRAALWQRRGDVVSATRTASNIGSAFAIVLMALGVFQLLMGNLFGAIWWFMIGAFLRMIAQGSYSQVLVTAALRGEPVRHFMTANPDVVPPDISVEQLVNEHIYRYHHRMFPVVTEGDHLAGCVTTEQIRDLPREEWPLHRVQEIAKPCTPDNTIGPDTDAAEAIRIMSRTRSSRLMIVDRDRLLGIVALRDLMNFLTTKLELEGKQVRLPAHMTS